MKKETLKYQSANLIRFIGDAFFYPFYALFLKYIGKSDSEIGIVLMIIPLISIFISPLWSKFSKNVNYNKTFAIVFSLVEAVAIISLLAFTNLYLIIFVTVILGAINQPFYSLFEGFITVYTIEEKQSYSKIRLFGSLGYAIGVLISGALIKATGKYIVSFFSVFGLFILVALILIFIKPLQIKEKKEETRGNFKELINNKNYLFFLFFYVITVATLFSGDSFWGVYFKYRGIDESLFGLISLGVYLLEVFFLFILSKYGDKFKAVTIMAIIVFSNVIRFVIYGFDAPFWLLVLSSFLRGFTMAGILYIVVRHLGVYVKKENITLGIVLFSSFKNTLQMVITLTGGFVIESFNYNIFYFSLGAIGLLAILFINLSQRKRDYVIMSKETNKGTII